MLVLLSVESLPTVRSQDLTLACCAIAKPSLGTKNIHNISSSNKDISVRFSMKIARCYLSCICNLQVIWVLHVTAEMIKQVREDAFPGISHSHLSGLFVTPLSSWVIYPQHVLPRNSGSLRVSQQQKLSTVRGPFFISVESEIREYGEILIWGKGLVWLEVCSAIH